MNEDDLKTLVIRDLHAKGVNVINLKNGTFDVLIEGSNPFLLELKIITSNTKKGDTATNNKKGFSLTEDQTHELLKTRFPIYVLANDGHHYYLFDPKWMKTQVQDIKGQPEPIIDESRWNDTSWNTISPLTYDAAINTLLKILYRR